MLNKQVIIDKIGIEYQPMLDQISIPDFTKCIAQFSGLHIQNVSEKAIEDYLTKWCINKKKFFDLMGGNIRKDIPFTYKDPSLNYTTQFKEIECDYPVLYPWLEMVKNSKENKIKLDDFRYADYGRLILDAFGGNVNAEGMSITRFFKQHLNASDDVVTRIGNIFENKEIDATFTISIDPVDMMLASENPYKWTSCYRLETDGFNDGHADGCLAAILDKYSLITYVWNNQGKFTLYNKYEFKNIRYKRMRMTIAMSEDFKAIHFNALYPVKGNCPNDFLKTLRDMVETFVAEQNGFRNMWKQDTSLAVCYREYLYGYSEYSDHFVWIQSDNTENEKIKVFNEPIICPCGCEMILPGSYDDDNYRYNGYGFICDHYDTERYCEITGEYEDCDGDCEHCSSYNAENMVCELDEGHYCENRDPWDAQQEGDIDLSENRIVSCNIDHCVGCPLFNHHHPEYFKDIIIKQNPIDTSLSLPILFARSGGEWYINRNNKYYKLDDERVRDDVILDKDDLDNITINLIRETQDDDTFEIYGTYENGLDLTQFLAKPEKDEELTTVSANPTSWTSNVGTVTLHCNGFGNTISTELCTLPSVATTTSSGTEGIDITEFHNMLDRIQDLETRLNTYNIPFEHTVINNAETDQHSDESEG